MIVDPARAHHPADTRSLDGLYVALWTRTLVFSGEIVASCALDLSSGSVARRTVALESVDGDDGEALEHTAAAFEPGCCRTPLLWFVAPTVAFHSPSHWLFRQSHASFGVYPRELNVLLDCLHTPCRSRYRALGAPGS